MRKERWGIREVEVLCSAGKSTDSDAVHTMHCIGSMHGVCSTF